MTGKITRRAHLGALGSGAAASVFAGIQDKDIPRLQNPFSE